MRQANVIKGDIFFQWKYGFYLLYILCILVYMIIFSFFEGNLRNIVVACCVYSDPAAMGMFFMGALILLEKSQHITSSIVISPVTPTQYIIGKVISFALISEIVGLILILFGHTANYLLFMVGILFGSAIFSLCGIIVGAKVSNLNQYILGTVPFELVGFAPVIAYRAGLFWDNPLMLLHPGCAAMQLLEGNADRAVFSIISLVIWTFVIYIIAYKCVKKMYQQVGE